MNIFKYSKTTIKDIELNNNSKSLFYDDYYYIKTYIK